MNNNNHNNMQIYLSPLVSQLTNTNYYQKANLLGSETDVSTSIENLSPEERHVLRTGIRQEPQGEETLLSNSPSDDMSATNTLIIHHNKSMDSSHYPVSPYFYGKKINANIAGNNNNNKVFNMSMNSIEDANANQSSQVSHILLNKMNNNAIHNINNNQMNISSNNMQLSPTRTSSSESVPSSPSAFNRGFLQPFQLNNSNMIADNSAQLQQPMLANYLNSLSTHWKRNDGNSYSDLLKHGMHLPPPPEYEREWSNASPNSASTSLSNSNSTTPESKSIERLTISSNISRSHPDLSKFDDEICLREAKCNELNLNLRHSGDAKYNMIDLLNNENCALKKELELYYKKVSKLQKFEMEIQKVHQSHEELMRSSEKKEKLERAIRYKLEIDSRRLQELNHHLKEQLDAAMAHISKRPLSDSLDDGELKKEIAKRDVLIAQLLSQNKELINEKDRQEIELQAQRLTLQEQRNHIDILDNALMSAQNNVIKLETECRKKQAYEVTANRLQKSLANLQLSSDRRLQMEKRVRQHLEKEIESLKKQQGNGNGSGNCKNAVSGEIDIEDMKGTIRDYEEKIITLESEVTKWEQKYLEESTMRHIELTASTAPKDAKIAALEKTSQESEKLIAEARNERLKHMDEIHVTNKRCAELEGKIKDLESKLAEKDAMIKVLQQHSRDKDAVLQKTVFAQRTPNRHTRSASTMGLTNNSNNSHTSNTIAANNCQSNNFNEITSLSLRERSTKEDSSQNTSHDMQSSESSLSNSSNGCNSDSNNLNLDEQLKELDSRLTNKDSIIRALRSEKERFPNHYNNWRL